MKNILLLSVIISLCTACVTMDIGTQQDKNANFTSYSSYAWLRRTKNFKHADARIDNDIVESRIITNVNKELALRGYKLDTLQPDLLLDYDIVTTEQSEQIQQPVYVSPYPFYYGPGIGPYTGLNSPFNGVPYAVQTTDISYQIGTVAVYLVDRKTNKLIWQGWAQGAINDITSFESELPKDIHAMFKQYPIKTK